MFLRQRKAPLIDDLFLMPFFLCLFQGKVYVFDRVLKPNVTQEQVYTSAAKSIVKGAAHLSAEIIRNLELTRTLHILQLLIVIVIERQFLRFRCPQRIQRHHLRVRSDLLGKDPHHGGSHRRQLVTRLGSKSTASRETAQNLSRDT